MSKSILDSLSEAQLAALQQIFTNNGEAVVESEPAKPVSKKTGFILIRAINASSVPDDEVVTEHHESDEVARWADDSPITVGDLRFAVEDGATRADGTKCRDYPNVWLLTQDQAYAAIQTANRHPKPKASAAPKNGFRPKAAAKPTVDAEGIEILIQREIAKALAGISLDAAKPQPAAGHTKSRKAAKSAKPIATSDNGEAVMFSDLSEAQVFKPGDTIWVEVNGEAVELQITEDAKRLRKTIA